MTRYRDEAAAALARGDIARAKLWILRGLERAGPKVVDREQRKMGRLSRRKGTRAENRDLDQWAERLGDDVVLSKRRQEAANIATGADYEIAIDGMRLLVQRKNAKIIPIPSVWRRLRGAKTRSDQVLAVHAEFAGAPNRKGKAAVPVVDIVALSMGDFGTIRGPLGRRPILPDVNRGFDLFVGSLQIRRVWANALAESAGRDVEPAIIVRYTSGPEQFVLYPWGTFVDDYCARVGPLRTG